MILRIESLSGKNNLEIFLRFHKHFAKSVLLLNAISKIPVAQELRASGDEKPLSMVQIHPGIQNGLKYKESKMSRSSFDGENRR